VIGGCLTVIVLTFRKDEHICEYGADSKAVPPVAFEQTSRDPSLVGSRESVYRAGEFRDGRQVRTIRAGGSFFELVFRPRRSPPTGAQAPAVALAAESQRDRAPQPRRRRAGSATPASWERPTWGEVSPRFAYNDRCTAECQQISFLRVPRKQPNAEGAARFLRRACVNARPRNSRFRRSNFRVRTFRLAPYPLRAPKADH
jgi:hypothetical protein